MRFSPRPCVCGIVLSVMAVAGCGDNATSPTSVPRGADTLASSLPSSDGSGGASAAGWGDYHPLALGDRWRYEYSLTFRLIPSDGSPPSSGGEGWWVDRSIDCERVVDGVLYRVEVSRDDFTGTQPLPPNQWVSYRQDRSGLYELAVSINDPACPLPAPSIAAASASAGEPTALAAFDRGWRSAFSGAGRIADDPGLDLAVEALRGKLSALLRAGAATAAMAATADELTRLRYPLHVGQTWTINPDIEYRARVVATRPLDLPIGPVVAHEVQYLDGFLGPGDDVRFWHSDQGALAMDAHLESEWRDETGTPRGTVLSEFRFRLIERTLSR